MRGVQCGPDHVPVDPSTLRRRAGEDMWTFEHAGIEFMVAGDERQPHPLRFEVARRVAAHLDAFAVEANQYLAEFVEPGRFDAPGPWLLESVEFGRKSEDSVDDFELFLVLEGDESGVWSVRFRFHGAPVERYWPEAFCRQQR